MNKFYLRKRLEPNMQDNIISRWSCLLPRSTVGASATRRWSSFKSVSASIAPRTTVVKGWAKGSSCTTMTWGHRGRTSTIARCSPGSSCRLGITSSFRPPSNLTRIRSSWSGCMRGRGSTSRKWRIRDFIRTGLDYVRNKRLFGFPKFNCFSVNFSGSNTVATISHNKNHNVNILFFGTYCRLRITPHSVSCVSSRIYIIYPNVKNIVLGIILRTQNIIMVGFTEHF